MKEINVTQTFLPPIKEYIELLSKAWINNWLTNRGDLVLELEKKIKNKLQLEKNLIVTTNGTIPLQMAVKLFGNNKEIITTPFSYVATTSSIVWENCKPVFVDIDPLHLTIDENKIEAAITENTSAILATHVFGNPCDVEKIEKIAKKHNIKVIYDAAHCFGVVYKGKSVFNFGDVSTCSFHATKIFHTGEGGFIISNKDEYADKLFKYHNFGHDGPENFKEIGINGKMSELQAAMGLSILPYIDMIFKERKKIVDYYEENLSSSFLTKILIRKGTIWNYSYYPIIFETENDLLRVVYKLNQKKIFPRRYFNPSLNTLSYLQKKVVMPISEDISRRIICLPLYVGLEEKDLEKIIAIINFELC
ncbi:dTDP-4-amino-4,6-dideoxygalactose transaminase [Lutibacter sp. Hel_I_33_5]|uniref:DegT/DnrJ/EryC1/StrS family aminotransferase n=1 Tax=Lutibacter sp. Hel_I_33_5 TaxID=1566289 RepID=UPI0011A62667|nr:DegT/DnrJ/EryC1/StrS family aminotransferase [Lutibacter sp. Hel_I_33_5]TVZ54851.1 dTDP-4-amino-4,6-dideoxygalactose transaminase [Lutibacter sp. Hel_I_33_5]